MRQSHDDGRFELRSSLSGIVGLLVARAAVSSKSAKHGKRLPPVLVGYIIECLVEAYALLGASGRLTTARPDSDVDHKDFIVDERGGYRSIYLQVKGATRLYRGTLRVFVRYSKGEVLSDPRLVYVVCLLDVEAMTLPRIWVIPAPEFSHLATRVNLPGGRVQLSFRAGRIGKWSRFEIEPTRLGDRLLEIIRSEHIRQRSASRQQTAA